MWLTNVSIRRPVFISMFVLALIILGWQAMRRMPAELNPDIQFPVISVITAYPGAGPQEIETLVSQPIEEAVSSVGHMRNVTSMSQDGVSVVFMELELGTDLDAGAADVRDKISAARGKLPRDIEEPQVSKLNITSQPIITIGFYGPQQPHELRHFAETRLKDSLSSVGGVASVTVSGGALREIAINVDKDRLDAYGLTIDQVTSAIRSENLTLPSGSIKQLSREYAVRAVGEFTSADQIRDIRLSVAGGEGAPASLVRLGDIAQVDDTVEEPNAFTRLNGRDAVVIAIQKQSDANTVDVAEGVKEVLMRLGYEPPEEKNGLKLFAGRERHQKVRQSQLPPGSQIVIASDESEFVKESLDDVIKSLMEGIFLVVVIIFVFLHKGRATFIVALAIPTSIFATFLPIWTFGFTLNTMTLLALALVVGILVDDSIVVLENIERHLRKGESPPDAALNGRSEIGLAAIAITLVDVVVFIPIAFMGGIVGQFFRQFGITVATATLFSLFVSFTLTPMLAAKWLREHKDEPENPGRDGRSGRGFLVSANERAGTFFNRFDVFYSALDTRYRSILAWAIENRFLTIVIGGVSLLAVIAMILPPLPAAPRIIVTAIAVGLSLIAARRRSVRQVAIGFGIVIAIIMLFVRFPFGFEMFPNVDQGQFSVMIEAPAGSSLNATDQVARDVEAVLADIPEMDYYQTVVGASSAGAIAGNRGSQYARVSVTLVGVAERERSIEDVAEEVKEKIAKVPGGQIRVVVGNAMGGSGELRMEVTGSDMGSILEKATAVQGILEKTEGAINVENSWKVGKPELQITVNRLRAADRGISVAQIATALRTAIEGNTDAKFREGGDQYDIRVRFAQVNRQNRTDVENVIVGYRNGAAIYLRDVADVELEAAPQIITRKNRQRLITVEGNIARGYSLGNVQQVVDKEVANLPASTAMVQKGGMGEIMVESFGYMFGAVVLAIVLVYMLMAALFESMASPLIIMFSLPQALVGALLALMLTGKTLSIVAMIGMIMLVGLVSKNAILMVDYTNTLRSRGKSRDEALLEAGPTRLRPILMTTMAMCGGMLPTAVALGATRGSEIRSPMAIAVIGGLLLSLFLTLLVIPTVYTLVDDAVRSVRRRFHGSQEEELEPEMMPLSLDEQEQSGSRVYRRPE